MKNIIIGLTQKTILFLGLLFLTCSCSETFLDEVPKDFLSPENTYTDVAGFESAITALHINARSFWEGNWEMYILFGLYSDYGVNYNNMKYTVMTSSYAVTQPTWTKAFTLIKNSNTIISRAENSNVKWNSESEKLQIIAEARFFRAWAYKILGNVFGGVPIIKGEITSPKVDFVRSTRAEVYQFAKEDLVYATENLPNPGEEKASGRITKGAAYHILAEVDICLEDWQEAIDAASNVINNSYYHLMTERFGKRVNMNGYNVYWDLFQRGNQNQSSGNKESIWVEQIEYGTTGGGTYNVNYAWCPKYTFIKDPDGKNGYVNSTEWGLGYGHITPTNYLQQTIWQDDWNDMRNSSVNIKRELPYNDPSSKYYGLVPTTDQLLKFSYWFYQPIFMKTTTPWDFPDNIINGNIYRDIYVIRLAETYLLRAEAYLGSGNKEKAAGDINIVRSRANATAVNAANVDINYILDERARELATEEFRSCTLMRLGLLYERTKKYSAARFADGSVVPSTASTTIQPYNNLWPIPQTEIDLNTGAVLVQNPGY